MDDWDPDFAGRSPLFDAVSAAASSWCAYRTWPSREALQRLVAERGVSSATTPLRLAAPGSPGDSYEARIYRDGEMAFREGTWHDFFNVLAWLAWPRTKSALNAAHYGAMAGERAPGPSAGRPAVQRGRARDALTLFDESGVIVASSEPELLEDVREFRWKRLFWERRERVRRSMRFHVLGHGLLEKALRPYVGMTAHAMLVHVTADVMAAPLPEHLAELDKCVAALVVDLAAPHMLAPLPLLGVPDWWPDNAGETFYDDAAYFRPGRTAMKSRE